MQESTDPISLAILDLEAESKVLQLVVGFLLAHSPRAFSDLEAIEPVLSDLASQMLLTDRQIAVAQETLSRVLAQVRKYQQRPQ